jgi:hypothetical protein
VREGEIDRDRFLEHGMLVPEGEIPLPIHVADVEGFVLQVGDFNEHGWLRKFPD